MAQRQLKYQMQRHIRSIQLGRELLIYALKALKSNTMKQQKNIRGANNDLLNKHKLLIRVSQQTRFISLC